MSAEAPWDLEAQYRVWCARHTPEPTQLVEWGAHGRSLPHRPRITLVVLGGPEEPTRPWEAIESARRQIYDHWELCAIVPTSTSPRTCRRVQRARRADPRVRLARLDGWSRSEAASEGLRMATGEFVAVLDSADALAPHALYRVVVRLAAEPDLDLLYTDEDSIDADGRRFAPLFKPDWAPDLLRSINYLGRAWVLRTDTARRCGGFRAGFDGDADYDLLLRAVDTTNRIAHIPDVLYHRRATPDAGDGPRVPAPGDDGACVRALTEALRRRDTDGRVACLAPGRYVVRYRLRARPLVSIIIPMRDGWALTARCVRSIENRTTYAPYEILLVDNQSVEPESLRFLEMVGQRHRVITFDEPFNYSRLNNQAVAASSGGHLVLLNNDTRVLTADWLEAMVEHAQRPEVGAVGARLLYPDGRVQHAGVVVLGTPGEVAGHAFRGFPPGAPGYLDRIRLVGNWSAVTGACLMTRRETFDRVGGFDERFTVAFGDVDLCLRLGELGLLVVYTPLATLTHVESASRGTRSPSEDDRLFRECWPSFFADRQDPYWSPHLSARTDAFSLAL